MNFTKHTRLIVFGISFVIIGYGIWFYQLGYQAGLWTIGWGALIFIANLFAKREPFKAYLFAAIASLIIHFTLKSYVPLIGEWPHRGVFIACLAILIGCIWDGYQWVYKFDKGKKLRNSYDN